MNSQSDQQLLHNYTASKSEAAFAELVRRHVDLVYSAALRMVCDRHLAEDVTQGAFIALAQNAHQLAGRPILSGWLHRAAQNLAANMVRSEVRRRAREQEAAAMNQLLANGSDVSWDRIAQHLDAALADLNEAERDAVFLRYFERKSAREMAQIFGTSEDAAQKRVSRAVEQLREVFAKRGVTVGASGLAAIISANAVQSAPAGLAAAISATTLAGTAVSTSAVITATKTVAMTTVQKILITATIATVAGAGIYEAHQTSRLREQNQKLAQQQAPLFEQIRQLQFDHDDLTNRLNLMAEEMEKTENSSNKLGLLRLRGEVASLRTALQLATESKRKSPTGRTSALKSVGPFLIPMTDSNGSSAEQIALENQLETQLERRISNVVMSLSVALKLTPEEDQKIQAILSQPTALRSGSNEFHIVHGIDLFQMSMISMSSKSQQLASDATAKQISENRVAVTRTDDQIRAVLTPEQLTAYERYMANSMNDSSPSPDSRDLLQMVKAYEGANSGQEPKRPFDLLPFAKTADEKATLRKLEQQGIIAPE